MGGYKADSKRFDDVVGWVSSGSPDLMQEEPKRAMFKSGESKCVAYSHRIEGIVFS